MNGPDYRDAYKFIELCNYCLALTQTLAGQGFSSEAEKHLIWLLYDLINYFAAELKAPRWLRTAGGVKFIDAVEVKAGCQSDWHSADIIAGLKKRGTTLSALSRQAGLASSTLANALTRR